MVAPIRKTPVSRTVPPTQPAAAPSRPGEAVKRNSAPALWADIPAFTAFSDDVAGAFDSAGQLSYSSRLKLLARARHFGIRRFDANLVIAMVQNRAGARPMFGDAASEPPPRRRRFPILLVVFLTLQSAIIGAGWWILSAR